MRLFSPVSVVLVFIAFGSVARADSLTQLIRDFTSRHAPEATAAQAKEFGLFLPEKVDATKPVVVLVHGLDMDRQDWNSIAGLLKDAGQQVAWFSYPEDQPIDDDVKLLTEKMTAIHHDQPQLKIDLVAFSMGSLVCRGYVEGNGYAGGVDRMILLSPPNHGSSWASFGFLSKCKEQIHQAMINENWKLSWFITSGLCEADCDLLPGSAFLERLNAQPRRAGVRYTVVEGDEHIARRITADVMTVAAECLPRSATQYWIVRLMAIELKDAASEMSSTHDCSDGPVKLSSADLDGVTDIVRVHADHQTMIQPHGGKPPVAWWALKERLVATDK
jgi:pimeloyl-ACP methyl ester carboxylesterase